MSENHLNEDCADSIKASESADKTAPEEELRAASQACAAKESGEKTTQEELIGFDIKTGEDDMKNFVLYHNYRCASGVLGLALSVAALVYLIIGFNSMDNVMRIALVFIGLLFTVVNPCMLSYKAKRQVRTNEGFKLPIHYGMTASYLILTQGEQWVQVPWKNIYKIVDTRRSIVIYVSRMRAYVWPKDQLGGQFDEVMVLLRRKVAPEKVRMAVKK